MGKKGKIGKQRKDRFYHLAKETGYRSRAAFKLIQLNRKFEFLQQSKVLIDLCAAPGGWLQVAQKYMPVQSVILGIDLAPIKPIFNVTTLQEDITTQKCRTFISKELKTWKADCVLHDGAPNVGKSWIHDAFEQNRLTLAALHLACDFLMKGGWFITKVFRSKDYNALMWVFKKLFKRVHATKPQASRNESAEIFVVCQGFLAPDKIDPKFFDSSYVFADVKGKESTMTKGDLLKALTNPKKSKAEGYDENSYQKLEASKFLVSKDYVDLLSKSNEIIIDRKDVREHPLTTFEVKECLKDLKVLGKKELNLLFNWRNEIRKSLKNQSSSLENVEDHLFVDDEEDEDEMEEIQEKTTKTKQNLKNKKTLHDEEADEDDSEDDDNDDEDVEDEEDDEEAKKLKRKKRKIAKEKRKLEERLSLKMVLKDDQLVEEEHDLFKMNDIKRKAARTMMNDDIQGELLSDSDDEKPQKFARVIKTTFDKDSSDKFYDPDDSDQEEEEIELDEVDEEDKPLFFEDDDDDDDDEVEKKKNDEDDNEMIVDFDTKEDRMKESTKRFFENELFQKNKKTSSGVMNFLDDDEDDDLELKEIQNRIAKAKKSKEFRESTDKNNNKKNDLNDKNLFEVREDFEENNDQFMSKFDGNEDDDIEDEESSDDDDDDDDDEEKKERKRDSKTVLTPEEMALGSMLIKSKKARREMMDNGWNRYVHEDDELMPSWFRKEESQYFRKPTPVTGEMIKEYNQKLKEINSKPIKKVLEAKNRKKKRALRKLEKARVKAESITDDADMTNKEKAQYIRSIYKKAVKKNTDKVQLVVGKKAYGKSRPPGVKGRYKIVDSRLKKDKRAAVNKEKTKGRGKKSSSGKAKKAGKGKAR